MRVCEFACQVKYNVRVCVRVLRDAGIQERRGAWRVIAPGCVGACVRPGRSGLRFTDDLGKRVIYRNCNFKE